MRLSFSFEICAVKLDGVLGMWTLTYNYIDCSVTSFCVWQPLYMLIGIATAILILNNCISVGDIMKYIVIKYRVLYMNFKTRGICKRL